MRQIEEPAIDMKEEKSIGKIRILHSDLNLSDPDPFLHYWIKLLDQAIGSSYGSVRDELHSGYLAHVYVLRRRRQLQHYQ